MVETIQDGINKIKKIDACLRLNTILHLFVLPAVTFLDFHTQQDKGEVKVKLPPCVTN
jgi:hypothetical protein